MRILYTRPDGGLTAVYAASKADIEKILGPLTEDAYRAHVWERSIPSDASGAVEISDDYQLPDFEFWDALKQEGLTVVHDLEKARTIQLEKIRRAREPKLLDLDREFMWALERNDEAAQLAAIASKEELRNITEFLKSMKLNSIEDVKGAFPDSLK